MKWQLYQKKAKKSEYWIAENDPKHVPHGTALQKILLRVPNFGFIKYYGLKFYV